MYVGHYSTKEINQSIAPYLSSPGADSNISCARGLLNRPIKSLNQLHFTNHRQAPTAKYHASVVSLSANQTAQSIAPHQSPRGANSEISCVRGLLINQSSRSINCTAPISTRRQHQYIVSTWADHQPIKSIDQFHRTQSSSPGTNIKRSRSWERDRNPQVGTAVQGAAEDHGSGNPRCQGLGRAGTQEVLGQVFFFH